MEELGRLHKDVPFGWVQMLAQWLGARRRSPAHGGTWRRAA